MFLCDVEDLVGEWLYVYLRVWWGSDPWLSLVGGIAWVASGTTHFHYTLRFLANLGQIVFLLHSNIESNILSLADTYQKKKICRSTQTPQAHIHGQMTFCSTCWGLTQMVSAGAGDDVDTDQLKGLHWLSGNLCCCLQQVKRVLCSSTSLPLLFSPSRHVPTKGASESTTLAL